MSARQSPAYRPTRNMPEAHDRAVPRGRGPFSRWLTGAPANSRTLSGSTVDVARARATRRTHRRRLGVVPGSGQGLDAEARARFLAGHGLRVARGALRLARCGFAPITGHLRSPPRREHRIVRGNTCNAQT